MFKMSASTSDSVQSNKNLKFRSKTSKLQNEILSPSKLFSPAKPRETRQSGLTKLICAKDNWANVISEQCEKKIEETSICESCFVKKDLIGTGSYGLVYHAISKHDNKNYAMKRFHAHRSSYSIKKEIRNHYRVNTHPNIVSFHCAWEESGSIISILELCEFSMDVYCESPKKHMCDQIAWFTLYDMTQALSFLHSQNLAHFDVKLANVLWGYDKHYKLADFSNLADIENEVDFDDGDAKYLAKEVLYNQTYSLKADVFSLGLTILELRTDLDLPKGGEEWIALREGRPPSEYFDQIAEPLQNLLIEMIQEKHTLRPDCDEILKLPIVQKVAKQKLDFILNSNPYAICELCNCAKK